ncbi:MAG: hypothetical protein IPP15_09165 [Saprospiraceae bacterium]|uniref:Uncharacterized protein n=1 Tax=Candidatus Opimibacter skivensis TaxID=2982028 RepID=A0A9D7SUZ6_9BACT|nr:hypothetical protein [Candidatus Opimibacter skivensis]
MVPIFQKLNMMKEVTIMIPEKKFSFFMELMNQLGLEVSQNYDIPEEHKSIVMERIKEDDQDPGHLEDWDTVKDQFNLDS